MSNSILITGANGYLGKNLLNLIQNKFKFEKIIAVTRNPINDFHIDSFNGRIEFISNSSLNIKEAFNQNQIQAIIHCATSYGSKFGFDQNLIESNILFPTQILNIAIENKVSHFINVDTALNKETSNYALSKYLFREILSRASKNICAINLRLEYFYGPEEPDGRFLKSILNKALNGEKNISLTSGEQVRDFIYISDVMSAIEVVINNLENFSNGVHNFYIAGDEPRSIRELVELITELVENCKASFDFGAIEKVSLNQIDGDQNIATIKDLGWRPLVSLRSGIIKLIEYETRDK